MGDIHFVIRHGLTGIVVVAFIVAGRVLAGQSFDQAMTFTMPNPAVLTALLPVAGVVVQGVYVFYLEIARKLFTDDARVLIRNWVDEALNEEYAPDRPQPSYIKHLRSVVHDSSFVWLYYVDVPAHLIDWARRRRSYHYLGVNWSIGAIIGMLIGFFAQPNHTAISGKLSTAIILCTVAWVVCALWLARLMKRDVDDMELAWAHARRYPSFRSRLGFTNTWSAAPSDAGPTMAEGGALPSFGGVDPP